MFPNVVRAFCTEFSGISKHRISWLSACIKVLFVALRLLSNCLPVTHAQVAASVTGFATDPSGAPIGSAQVTVKNTETGAIRSSTTDEAGHYQVLSLSVGQYEV